MAATGTCTGSSPRLRGTHALLSPDIWVPRFIPASAGNTRYGQRSRIGWTVHPRVCGEHARPMIMAIDINGSSPRLRGTRHGPPHFLLIARFIPASAGNTRRQRYSVTIESVHPRVCGEHGAARRPPPLLSVHPRVCGEHYEVHVGPVIFYGSSPRLRGTRQGSRQHQPGARFIPASAGNTCAIFYSPKIMSVHPRVCGEHLKSACSKLIATGSSPRLRGTLVKAFFFHDFVRFIPASAGNTGSSV